ncbi:type VI secretion system baseplate subunit TssF [Telmatospirillum sp.]|uniref:type VI secretion system baseplate subunit TssF n=1 Tax=Telmatospirillum sp. TaxID=2079197 RepID=UPI00283AC296|nr:type VI secretion system baseplate subunit TssF [Telmatospirillum sp.]MDR3435250.1 type VI secretion system baseplate subunit TssF [Telmatospirillum sp.]
MTDSFLTFYNQELAAIRHAAAAFAVENPKVAGHLRLSASAVDDPHVARLIESFAFLTAGVRQKLDDDFPELTDSLLGVLYPHYVTPMPSMTIVQMAAAAELTGSFTVPRGAAMETEPVRGEPCRFRTTMPAEIWPVEVTAASFAPLPVAAPQVQALRQAKAVLRLKLSCTAPGLTFGDLGVDRLRFFLPGAPELSYTLHELLLNNVIGMALVTDLTDPAPVEIGPEHIRAVGFEPEDGMLPYPAQSFIGYRLLSELFTFPEKFLFFELSGLTAKTLRDDARSIEVYFYLDRTWPEGERLVRPQAFALGCTPVINLFKQPAEPIILGHDATEYHVLADARRPEAREIYSIEKVVASSPQGERIEFLPLYGTHHGRDPARQSHFWHMARRSRGGRDHSSEIYLSLVDLGLDPAVPAEWTVSVETICFNRDLPAQLPFGGGHPRLHLVEGGPVQVASCLTPPTAVVRPRMGDSARWRLISHLTLNHLSLLDESGGAPALRELLKLYDLKDTPETRAIVDAVAAVDFRRVTARAPHPGVAALCRGIDIDLTLDAERAGAMGVFLPGAVLERFFALYVSINSFTRLALRAKGRSEVLKRWPARIGDRVMA